MEIYKNFEKSFEVKKSSQLIDIDLKKKEDRLDNLEFKNEVEKKIS